MTKAAALARDVAVEIGNLISRDLTHGSELGFFGLAQVSFGALDRFTASANDGQYRQRAVVAIELDKAVTVEFSVAWRFLSVPRPKLQEPQ